MSEKKDGGYSLTMVIGSGVGGLVLGMVSGWMLNDMSREAEQNATKAPAKVG